MGMSQTAVQHIALMKERKKERKKEREAFSEIK